ncbi:hypothetical protein P2W68_09880 [Chryseobacterium arthrosphaerae]|uniref:hypothetical protein n=1 Tax=Chryseobacterium arthrosphaerae TaxID=651561 RepID=UPI0023E192E4|nr:hypothetical protein [Chryseobacterium arthrosphaerae]WES99921.1 hypothetical protein P2W68_09880 [Chryseobacterium arthrosphaerae]
MSTVISYENEYFDPVTEEEALASNEFVKIIKINGRTKIREEYIGGVVVEVTYYQENEPTAEVFAQYPLPILVNIIHRKETRGNYLKEEMLSYNKDREIQFRSFTFNIVHQSTEQSICFGSYDLETGEVKNDSVVKTKYDAYGDAAYTYYYDVSGKVYVMEEGNGGLFSGEFPENYYSEALPLFPETENKDNTGLKSL